RAGEARAELAVVPRLAHPEGADRVAIAVVPLAPAGREVAELVAAGADVPGLGDQLRAREHRVLGDRLKERRARDQGRAAMRRLAPEHRRQVEAEGVDVHLLDPVAQRIEHELQYARMPGVERIARAGEVLVVR